MSVSQSGLPRGMVLSPHWGLWTPGREISLSPAGWEKRSQAVGLHLQLDDSWQPGRYTVLVLAASLSHLRLSFSPCGARAS